TTEVRSGASTGGGLGTAGTGAEGRLTGAVAETGGGIGLGAAVPAGLAGAGAVAMGALRARRDADASDDDAQFLTDQLDAVR
ncbi:MAG: hypothetical protein ACTMIR_13140, partial [Cellulomonadaceae bacterium]